ncbi:hypothetical protein COLO4_04499 [Corchorus olitorius]|uniref:Uncharacterized protein n=1 Tax=Corchorus olitorius TaxID=93759 RepID=A0A1R3KTT2_9ROSI|nr:hypothetical protein COLO4_04499 [Corchorus olitorius]
MALLTLKQRRRIRAITGITLQQESQKDRRAEK